MALGLSTRRAVTFLYEGTRTITFGEYKRVRERWLADLDQQADALIAEGLALRAKIAAERQAQVTETVASCFEPWSHISSISGGGIGTGEIQTER